MASRSGSGSRRQRSRDPREEFPSLPAPRLPSMRVMSPQPEADNTSQPSTNFRAMNHAWAASRRADRIRSLDEPPTLRDWHRALDGNNDSSWRTNQPPLSSTDWDRISRAPESRSSNLDDLDRSLDEANSHLRALLEMTNHPEIVSIHLPLSRPHDFNDDNPRNKRRKIELARAFPNVKIFRYGKYGQVEPGHLRMEMVSCDGGMYSNERSFVAENILRDDDSVYCTKSNRCNIILRHQGATAFTLKELVIKGPTSRNYSHPVREGMVFMSMKQDEQLDRTAHYQIQYAPVSRSYHGINRDDVYQAYVQDRENRQTRTIRFNEDGTSTTLVRRSHVYRDEGSEYRIAQMPREFSAVPNVGVTTECSDEEEDEDVNGRRFTRRAPNRIGALPFETPDSDEDNNYNDLDMEAFLSDGSITSRSRPRHDETDVDPAETSRGGRGNEFASTGGELLEPHARFLIENKKSTCTIHFDPPVTGRFILLKMWNSHHDPTSNIDIQSVIARGFAGPRYFPSVELR